MKSFSDKAIMRGPGDDLAVKSQEEVATILADAMVAGNILIPTHEKGWETIREHPAAPDLFVRGKARDFTEGRSGLPGRR